MDAVIWMTGYVGSDVEFREVREDLVFASFRLACTPRTRKSGEWVDGETTWLGVTCSRALADNARSSITKGDPVIVVGKLRTNRWQDSQGVARERLLLEAVAIGHDLNRGTASFTKNTRPVVDEVQVNLGELVMATEFEDEETGTRAA
ncbi:MAG: single-stranded DNA-binding protein [Propionicimonas sp.]